MLGQEITEKSSVSLRGKGGSPRRAPLSEEEGSNLPVARSLAETERQVSFHLVGGFQVSAHGQTQISYLMIHPSWSLHSLCRVFKQKEQKIPLGKGGKDSRHMES